MNREDLDDWLLIILMITVEVILGAITIAAIIAIGTIVFFLGVDCGTHPSPGAVCTWMAGGGDR